MASIPDRSGLARHARALLSWRAGWRTRLALAVLFAVGLGFALGDPAPREAADPELARLLRGMGLVKAMLVAAALRVVWWRLGASPAPGLGWAYVAVPAVMALGAVLAWQLSALVLVSVLFHGALLTGLLVALRDDGVGVPGRRR